MTYRTETAIPEAPVASRSGPPGGNGRSLTSELARVVVAIVVGVGGLVLASAIYGTGPWSWVLWFVVGVLVGGIARRAGFIWVIAASLAGFYVVASGLSIVKGLGGFWVIGAATAVAVMSVGYAIGTLLGWRLDPVQAVRSRWSDRSRAARRLMAGSLIVALVAFAGYTGYLGAIGSEAFVHPSDGWKGCDTPRIRFGWDYEAINYQLADDTALAAAREAAGDPLMTNCGTTNQGAPAGSDVVSSDGARLDGWYIPAASGAGPTGPTLIVIPGWKSNKSEILLYAPPVHQDYNLVLMDLRSQGRSSRADVTLGLNEQRDVAAMLDWLERSKHPDWIGAVGNSMGAATLLAEAGGDPRIQAFVLDSMHAHLDSSVGNVLETEKGHPAAPGGWAIMTGVSIRIGADVATIDPVRTITRIGDRPVLLLHSTTDKIDPPAQSAELNFQAAVDAGVPVELHLCKGETTGNGSHGRVVEVCKADWTRWANQFLAAARGA
jgi:pimeloyl-ACP methyl ester carboxylesterase